MGSLWRFTRGDLAQADAAREGLGEEGVLLIDAGQIFGDDVERAAVRLEALSRNRVTFFEEPFGGASLVAYRGLAEKARGTGVGIAGVKPRITVKWLNILSNSAG
ncbi:enolase C-terminal domain-like protein [Gemmobacter sp. 24YEA27]|uniref:enolase C-terminal domain-like protein n=1 Tax=Gemmobacter sp. 24YEA27 TaxID=3040672 RepID=UPI0032C42B96